MRKKFTTSLQNYLQIDKDDAVKLILSSLMFFFIIGAYSILRSLKTSIFLGFVGREYEPIVKMVGIAIAVPAMLLLAKTIDLLKKHQVVFLFFGLYICVTASFALLFAHPTYGVANTLTSPYRITGWAFEIFMDLFQALIVGTFWSFLNSISTPTFAERSYGPIVAGSRVGGIITTFISWILISKTTLPGTTTIPLLTGLASIFLLLAFYCMYLVMQKVPKSHMHGYEAAYVADKKDERSHKHTNVFEGLRLILTQPYVLGVFALVFSYEVINIIFDYQMHVLMSIETNNDMAAMSSFMMIYTGTFQVLSLLFAVFGTSALLKRLGVRYGILVMPIATMVLAVVPFLYPRLIPIFIVMVLLRALNYGFNTPLREMLFIPTTKDIKFKSKAWIESFGRTFSKTTGSSINLIASKFPHLCMLMITCFSVGLSIVWACVALGVGKKHEQTIADNDVIGKSE